MYRESEEGQAQLARAVERGRALVLAIFIFFLLMYCWTVLAGKINFQEDTAAKFGQFGDFIGGMLNPVVAFAALYWLTRSILLQKQELTETRRALDITAQEQTKQTQFALAGMRLQGLNAMISSILTEVQVQRGQIEFLVGQIRTPNTYTGIVDLNGATMEPRAVHARLHTLADMISKRMTERAAYEAEIVAILKAHPGLASADSETFSA